MAPDSTFTYQGSLEQAGVSYDGAADFEFSLWGAAIFDVCEIPTPNNHAGYFKGNVHVEGTLSKSGGNLQDRPPPSIGKTKRFLTPS